MAFDMKERRSARWAYVARPAQSDVVDAGSDGRQCLKVAVKVFGTVARSWRLYG